MDITIIVYGKGNPNLQPFAERGFDWVAVPAEGFPSRFEAIIAHEFDNSIVSWANFFGFKNIYTQYEPGAAPGTYVDCSKFPDSASCYTAVLGQLNDDIRFRRLDITHE